MLGRGYGAVSGLFCGCLRDVLWWLVPVVKMGDDQFVLAVKGEGDRERDSPGCCC